MVVLIAHHFDSKSQIFHNLEAANFLYIVLAGIVGLLANLLAIKSYQLIPPTVASIVRCQEIVFAFILQAAFMAALPHFYSILGALLVVMSAIMIPLEEMLVRLIPNQRLRNIL